MILVDTSIWIELLNGRLGDRVSKDDLQRFVTCAPVLQELFQGLRDGPATDVLRDSLLALRRVHDPLPLSTYLEAAEIYRQVRRRGNTVRSSNDCLIAAIAIANKLPLWHRDRDYETIAKFTNLETVQFAPEAAGHP